MGIDAAPFTSHGWHGLRPFGESSGGPGAHYLRSTYDETTSSFVFRMITIQGRADRRGEHGIEGRVAAIRLFSQVSGIVDRLGRRARDDRDVRLDPLLAIGAVLGRVELGSCQFEAGRGRS